jgi:hypothetical protein
MEDYAPPVSAEGESLDISEFHLRQAIEEGGRILRVIVVVLGSTGDYLPWIRLADRRNYLRLATRKYEGPKAFRDFRTLQRTIDEFGFTGPLYVYQESHPFLTRLTR